MMPDPYGGYTQNQVGMQRMDGYEPYLDLPTELPGQCAWCGLVESGNYQGKVVFYENEQEQHATPILVPGYSHGVCPVCDAVVRSTYRLKKAQRCTPSGQQRYVEE